EVEAERMQPARDEASVLRPKRFFPRLFSLFVPEQVESPLTARRAFAVFTGEHSPGLFRAGCDPAPQRFGVLEGGFGVHEDLSAPSTNADLLGDVDSHPRHRITVGADRGGAPVVMA